MSPHREEARKCERARASASLPRDAPRLRNHAKLRRVSQPLVASVSESQGRSTAVAVRRAGWLLAVGLIVGPAVDGALAGDDWRSGLLSALLSIGAGTLLMLAAAVLTDRLFLPTLRAEIRRGNLAAALVGASHAIALGWLTGHCFGGEGVRMWGLSPSFLAIAVATLLVFQRLYRWHTRYADDQEVRGENAAAALCYAGVTLAFAVIIGHAADGPFLGWAPSLLAYGRALLLAVFLYPVRQVVTCRLLLRLPTTERHGLDRAIAQGRDVAVGAVEAIAYVAVALLVTGIG